MHPFSRRAMIAGSAAGLLLPAAARAAGEGPITSKIIVEDNRLWLAASIQGGPPRLFCVDTGAGQNFMRPEIAKELRLQIVDNGKVGGLGKDWATIGVAVANELVIGGTIHIPHTRFSLYDFGNGLAADAAGLLAAGIFTTLDSDVDFEAGEWRLWRKGRPDAAGLTPLPSRFMAPDGRGAYSDRLQVTATLGGRQYRLLCDTGAPNGILLFSTTTRMNHLFDATSPFAVEQTSGFGGRAAKLTRVMRMGPLQLGPLVIDRPLVRVMDPDQTSHVIDYDGVIGLEYLQLLTLATDTRTRKLLAKRNGRPLPPDRYRLAGMWLDRADDGGATVRVVGSGSPAAAAGLQAGDRITDPPTFEEALRRVSGPAGKAVALGVTRDGKASRIGYTLQAYL